MVLTAEVRSESVVNDTTLALEVTDHRVIETRLHFDPGDKRNGRRTQRLKNLVTLVGRAEAQAMRLLRSYCKIETTNGEDGEEKITRAELHLPCADPEKLAAARRLLDPGRDEEGGGRAEGVPASLPRYLNSYHLVEIIEQPGETPVLRFVLLETYETERELKSGEKKKVSAVVTIDVTKALQQLILSWLAPPLFARLPTKVKGGSAQEVAQSLASYLGIREKNDRSRPNIGFPSFDQADPRLMDKKHPLRRQPLRFIGSGDVVVYRRLWHEEGKRRVGLYAAIPLDFEDANERGVWWHNRVAEFTPLPMWGEARLITGKRGKPKKLMLVPLSIGHGWDIHRFREQALDLEALDHERMVEILNGKEFQPCWSLVVERGGEFYLQLVLKRNLEITSRPNICGVHLGLAKEPNGWSIKLHWVCGNETGEIPVEYPGEIRRGGAVYPVFDHRKRRRELACLAAIKMVEVARRLDADLAVEEVVGVKKRGQKNQPGGGALMTRFNFSALVEVLKNEAVDQRIACWWVKGFALKAGEAKDLSPSEKAAFVARLGLEIRNRKQKA